MRILKSTLIIVLFLALSLHAAENGDSVAGALPPVEKVSIGPGRAFHVNGRPFFPLMVWLQDAKNFPAARLCGMNTVAGYWPKSSGTKDVTEYLPMVKNAGFYGVMPFHRDLKGDPSLLGYIHGDEPDLPRKVSDAQVIPAKGLRINRRTPLSKLLDGVTHSWSVLDPLENAEITIQTPTPVTVRSLAVWLTVSKGLALAREIRFEANGKEILKAVLKPEKGQQKFNLGQPQTFSKLQMTVTAITPGDQVWGSMAEIEGFDDSGKNVLLAAPRTVPRATHHETMDHYRVIKAADPSRPVFMTLTGNFHPFFKKWPEEEREDLYGGYIKSTDVVGYDIYPIYGWNKPEWIHLVQEATELLWQMADPRPVYAWIETSKGGQWTGPLDRQKEVRPRHIRAEVWMSICRGATAIGYFTHIWKPGYNQFGVPEANRKALREINDQITRLTPEILGAQPKQRVSLDSGGVKVDMMARRGGKDLTVFAVNYDEQLKKSEVKFMVPGLKAGAEVGVVDENRTIRSGAGSFTDSFEPLAVHIYRIED
ncbi:MAG: hypothetical protein QGI24_03870 [Kiritimatiellia bacterium]|nr:hypothetical protein [Kiritimatiellia bacterium]MDP6847902.1 hypothetical protein [Kiritimatiellia bacterium]